MLTQSSFGQNSLFLHVIHIYRYPCIFISLFSDDNKAQSSDKTTDKTSEPNTQAGEHGLMNDSERREEELSNTKNGAHTFSLFFCMVFNSGLGYNHRVS